jgi:Arc-like DNA binding domain
MSPKPLSVAVPETLLKRIRSRARRAKRTVEAEVIQLLTDAVSAEDAVHSNGSLLPVAKKKPGTRLADWAEKHGEHWGDRVRSEDVESFTGRRY